MALVERIKQMKEQGMSEEQIKKSLLEERFTPVQIREGLSQTRIKGAVLSGQQVNSKRQIPISGQGGMQPSIMQVDSEQPVTYPEQESGSEQSYSYSEGASFQENETPYAQEGYASENNNSYATEDGSNYDSGGGGGGYVQNAQEGYASGEGGGYAQEEGDSDNQEQYYPQEAYYQPEAYYQQALDTETVRDIAEQVIETELRKTKEQIEEILKLKTQLQSQIEDIDDRLKRIEDTISELQSAILNKIGNYGEAIDDISKELRVTQESFSKLAGPIIDEKRKIVMPSVLPKVSAKKQLKPFKKSQAASSKRNQKSSPSFEDYFR